MVQIGDGLCTTCSGSANNKMTANANTEANRMLHIYQLTMILYGCY